MSEKYRPRLHFAPRVGWMNDPNGLVVVDGTYHLFFQHDPDSIRFGSMHWGHASSSDLVNWVESPVALHPNDLGACYSGSAIETEEGDIKLFYTSHRKTEDGRDFQTQCLVHADRGMTTFTAQFGNPVLDNPGLHVFRDPKVVWHAASGRWIMALTHGQAIAFYSSTDMIGWTFESEFGAQEGRHGAGVWECPDLLSMTGPDGQQYWVLLVSLSSDAYGPGSGTQYFIGQFDGHHFTNANPPQTELWFDYGRDFYAAQTFFDRTAENPISIAWVSNWTYAEQTPTESFRGLMSLPRELRLVETTSGLRLSQQIPARVQAAFAEQSPTSGTFHRSVVLQLTDGEVATIALFGESLPQFRLQRHGNETVRLETVRTAHPRIAGFSHSYTMEFVVPPAEPIVIDLYVDRGLVEIGVDKGRMWLTNLFFPENPEGELHIDSPRQDRSDDVVRNWIDQLQARSIANKEARNG